MNAVEETWEAAMSEEFGGLHPEQFPIDSAEVTGSLRSAELGNLGIFDIRGTPQSLHRTTASVRSAPIDAVKICISRCGTITVHQGDTEVRIGPGEMTLYDTARPYELLLAGDWECTVMTVPREALTLPWSVVAEGMTRSMSARRGPASVLCHLIDEGIQAGTEVGVETEDRPGPGPGGADTGPSVLNSLGSEVGLRLLEGVLNAPIRQDLAMETGADLDRSRSLIRSWIVTNARTPRLSHDDVARAHHLSSRSLHRLFETEELSATQLIRESRLAGVRGDLVKAQFERSPVMAVASRWGFTDQAHFTRAFRAAYGTTPGAYRRTGGWEQ